jgi:hypothetical protein
MIGEASCIRYLGFRSGVALGEFPRLRRTNSKPQARTSRETQQRAVRTTARCRRSDQQIPYGLRSWRFEEQTRILFCFRKGKASRCEKGINCGRSKAESELLFDPDTAARFTSSNNPLHLENHGSVRCSGRRIPGMSGPFGSDSRPADQEI